MLEVKIQLGAGAKDNTVVVASNSLCFLSALCCYVPVLLAPLSWPIGAERTRTIYGKLLQVKWHPFVKSCNIFKLSVDLPPPSILHTPPVFLFSVSGFPCFVLEVILFWRCHCHCRCYSNSIQSDISHINDTHFLAPKPRASSRLPHHPAPSSFLWHH